MKKLMFSLVAAMAATAVAAETPPEFGVVLRPGGIDAAAGRGFVDVTLTVPQVDVAAGAPLLTLPVVIANTDTVANTLTGLKVTDALGDVPVTAKDYAASQYHLARLSAQSDPERARTYLAEALRADPRLAARAQSDALLRPLQPPTR